MVLLSVSLSGESKAKSLYRSLCHGRGDYKRLHQAVSFSLSYGVGDGANRLGGTWVELRFFRPPAAYQRDREILTVKAPTYRKWSVFPSR